MIPAADDRPEERIARLQDALHRIRQWCEAYSPGLVPEPDLEAIRQQIGGGPFSALHAGWARHVLAGIGRIAAEAM